jgi:hypothetical protein
MNFIAIQVWIVEEFEGKDRVRVITASGQGAAQPRLPFRYEIRYSHRLIHVAETRTT